MENFRYEVTSFTSEDMCLFTDYALIDGIYIARCPMWVIRLDPNTGMYTFTDLNTRISREGFSLARLVPIYLR